jgi:hypothetical protein
METECSMMLQTPSLLNGVEGSGSRPHYKNLSVLLNLPKQDNLDSNMESLFLVASLL